MKIRLPFSYFIFGLMLLSIHCTSPEADTPRALASPKATNVNLTEMDAKFKDYWYQGKAEITSYELEQARYGEIHQGNAVLVFVTEPFSKSKQVKMDSPSANPKDALSILKLNSTKKFNTGIYPYSTMQSIFTPVDSQKEKHTLKVTASSQEWCGHTFQQLNLQKDHYENRLYSYFESEGDQRSKLDKTWMEDEIWNRIRINPKSLPTGEIQMIPSTIAARFQHFPLKNESATASINPAANQKGVLQYEIKYHNIDRSLRIQFSKAFPHEILGWEEAYRSGWGSNAKSLVTKAKKKKQLMIDYWSKNGLQDAHYRSELGLE